MNVKLHAITFDCSDPEMLAKFWSAFLNRKVDPTQVAGFATIGMKEGAPFYVFQRLDGLPAGRNRVHVDFSTRDIEADTQRAIKLGATLVEKHAENGIVFNTLADPEGNKFDIAAE